ncbi:hypothetical protein OF83DRAFT_1084792 [Amylostereum chailletii]|nr:hypothetical protein OF83DRAFT_1084792 [Amylostereum chailletii]
MLSHPCGLASLPSTRGLASAAFTNVGHHVQEILATPHARPDAAYGEDIPFDSAELGDWCIARISAWATTVGMEAFSEAESEGRRTLTLGGKVLVLDVDLAVDPSVDVLGVRTSYAVPTGLSGEGGQTTQGSSSLDGYLVDALKAFTTEARKGEYADALAAARLARGIQESLKYLMHLDRLAENVQESSGGIRWFRDIDNLGKSLERSSKAEADFIIRSEGIPAAPLDILLLRGHALPLPYLLSPTLSFLIHISPRYYLALQRNAPTPDMFPGLPTLTITPSHLRPLLAAQPHASGVTIATLVLTPSAASYNADSSGISLSGRPFFPLAPELAAFDHTFPITPSVVGVASAHQPHTWYLDFTSGGRTRGVVVSQSRMREIESVFGGFGRMENTTSISFGTVGWVDMLLNPAQPISSECYTSIYTSPSGSHPPLELRFSPPVEPGFILERIVREQCWLNELLNGCIWAPDRSSPLPAHEVDPSTTEEELASVLSGTLAPHKIPVNVYIPLPAAHPTSTEILFDAPVRPRPCIMLSSPERPPIIGLVQMSITHDVTRPRGVSVHVRGAMGADIPVEVLEEAVRRGGLFGLPGRVWAVEQTVV